MKTTNIRIHKHTKVRRPMSKWVCGGDGYHRYSRVHVQDIKRGLENPLDARTWEVVFQEWKDTHPHHKQQKGDWNETLKDMREQTKFSSRESYNNGLKKELNILQSKSLLERMKARFK